MDASKMSAARTVIYSNGRAYRVALTQPPHFRKGQDAAPAIDTVARAAETALRNAKDDVIERSKRRNPH